MNPNINIPTIPSGFPIDEKINPSRMYTPSRHSSPHAKGRIKNTLVMVVFIALTVSLVGIAWNVASKQLSGKSTSVISAPKVAGTKSIDINQTFRFEAVNRQKKALEQPIEYTITSVEKSKEIVLKLKRARAIEGKIFLVVNLKLRNDNDDSAIMQTREFIRLLPDGLAPELHNDPIDVQPISAKETRLGFAVRENARDLKLQIGTITGEKTTIDLNF